MSPVSIVLGAILGLFWRYEYMAGWSPEPLSKNYKKKSIKMNVKIFFLKLLIFILCGSPGFILCIFASFLS